MDIFLSWSFARAEQVAALLERLVDNIFGKRVGILWSKRIAGGEEWRQTLQGWIERSRIAIVVITPENLGSPWLNFESGSIWGRLEKETGRRLIPFLYDVDEKLLQTTVLAQYQFRSVSKNGTMSLVKDINTGLAESGGKGLSLNALESAFERRWPEFAYGLSLLEDQQAICDIGTKSWKTLCEIWRLLDTIVKDAKGSERVFALAAIGEIIDSNQIRVGGKEDEYSLPLSYRKYKELASAAFARVDSSDSDLLVFERLSIAKKEDAHWLTVGQFENTCSKILRMLVLSDKNDITAETVEMCTVMARAQEIAVAETARVEDEYGSRPEEHLILCNKQRRLFLRKEREQIVVVTHQDEIKKREQCYRRVYQEALRIDSSSSPKQVKEVLMRAVGMKLDPIEPTVVPIQVGRFFMGSDKDCPERFEDERKHEVTIGHPFSIGVSPVTVGEFRQYQLSRLDFDLTSSRNVEDEDIPITNMSWREAMDYAEWLSSETGNAYRLPTEAEWEYAARAGTETNYWTSDDIDQDAANFDKSAEFGPVGSAGFKPNPWGLYHVHGNVWEMTSSEYVGNYSRYQLAEVQVANRNTKKWIATRGGSWTSDKIRIRSAKRYKVRPFDRAENVGFRLVLVTEDD